MAIRISTGLRNAVLGGVPARNVETIWGTGLAAVDNGGSDDHFTTSDGDFTTAGISVGDSLLAYGFSGGMAGIHGPWAVTSVAAGTMGVPTGSLADDAAGETVYLVVLKGGSIRDQLKGGKMCIYTGTQPASADAAATGTKLCTITKSGAAHTAGTAGNGLELGSPANGMVSKTTDTWRGTNIATGEAGWFRFYGNGTDGETATTTLPRLDGSITEEGGGGDITFNDATLTSGNSHVIDTFTISLPSA